MAELKIDASDTFEGSAVEIIRQKGSESGAIPAAEEQQPVAQTEQEPVRDEVEQNDAPQTEQEPSAPSWKLSDIFGEDVDVETAKQRYSELKEKASQTDQVFANDYLKGLNEYIKAGGTREAYDSVVSVDIAGMDGIDAIKTMIMWENPGLEAEDVKLALLDKYRQLEDDSEHDRKVGKVQLLLDEKEARKKLKEIQESHKLVGPERSQKEMEMQEAKRIDSWAPHAQNMVKSLNTIDFDLGNGSKFAFGDFTEQDKAELNAELMNIIRYSGINPTNEDMKSLQSVLRERAIVKKFDKIVSAIYNEASTISAKAARNEYHNSEVIRKGDPSPAKGTVSPEDNLFERQMAYLQGGRR